jgi:hypothetical protein
MSEVATPPVGPTIADMPWQDIELPPTDLPYDDGDKSEHKGECCGPERASAALD